MQTSQFMTAMVTVTIVLTTCSACLITNCPKGGKRSLAHGQDTFRQCPRCGPAKMGHCYGADICCGEEIGCLMANVDTLVCQREHLLSDPCVGPTGDAPCGSNGKCSAPGVCCTPDSCTVDASCGHTLSQEMANLYMYNVGGMRGTGHLSDVDEK